MEYGKLYKCENGNTLVAAHDPSTVYNQKFVIINKFISEHGNDLKNYGDAFIGNDELTITWTDNKEAFKRSTYKLVTELPHII